MFLFIKLILRTDAQTARMSQAKLFMFVAVITLTMGLTFAAEPRSVGRTFIFRFRIQMKIIFFFYRRRWRVSKFTYIIT